MSTGIIALALGVINFSISLESILNSPFLVSAKIIFAPQ